ncbi:MAG: DUF87 domain-containing protein [Flexilinea sp.]
MTPIDPKKFYLGKFYDSKGILTDEKLLYDPEDLNTHCVITGMTGSGKTGLGIALLEEIALKNIPAIIIDPKGDLTNLLLHFPEMKGEDFSPWIDPEAPLREGKDLYTIAEETADNWRKGLAGWGYGSEEIAALKKVSYTIFTPGSTVGNPINIMSSFDAPERIWGEGDEDIREEISTSVTALLDLIGISNIDPIQSREHILLSNIIEQYWSMHKSIDIEEMINAITDPPFEKLGALSVETMYPAKERIKLSLLLNNFLASPSFQTWSKGPNLDIGNMLYSEDGRARFNIFYIQHLSDHERMFFVTMLYSQIEAWMRTQTGTGNLRLGVYFDEIAGYLPASGNPASRFIILRMLKQARAFGVSMILSSQNPIDFDYKALSNAGTWFIGHLQTEQDKNRLLDGLTTNAGEIDRVTANKLISELEKRQFLYMNVHKPGLKVFTSRWVMNYLAGPLTRNLIPLLIEKGLSESNESNSGSINKESTAEQTNLKEGEETMSPLPNDETKVPEGSKPVIASTISEYYRRSEKSAADCGASSDQINYVPVWFAQTETRIFQRKYNLDFSEKKAAMIEDQDIRGTSLRWENYTVDPIDASVMDTRPEGGDPKFETPPEWMLDARSVKSRETDFVDYVYRESNIKIRANEKLGVYAKPDLSDAEFLELCKAKINEASQIDRDKLTKAYEKIVDKLEVQIRKAEADVEDKTDKMNSRNLEKFGAYGELALSLLTGRRRSVSTSLNKTGLSSSAQNALEKAQLILAAARNELETETESYKESINEIETRWEKIAEESTEITIVPMKKDIFTDFFGIVWMPCYLNDAGKLVKAY